MTPESFRFLRRVIQYIKPYKWLAALNLLAAVIAAVMDLIPPWLIKRAIDEGIAKQQTSLLITIVAILVCVYLVKAFCGMARIRLNNAFEQKVIFNIRNEAFVAVQRLSLSYFDDHSTGELLSRINSDVENMERIFIDGLEHLVVAVLTLLSITLLLFFLEWRLALVAFIPLPPLIFSSLFFTRRLHGAYKTVRQEMSHLMAFLQDRLSGIRETLIFNQQKYEANRFLERNRALSAENLGVARLWSLYSPSMSLFASLGTVLVLGVGSFLAASGQITIGELVAFISYTALFYTPMNQIHAINHLLQHAIVSSERVFELLDTMPTVSEPKQPIPLAHRLSGEISFQNVSFEYLPNRPVLEEINFTIAAGEKVALVGVTGSGKSTTVSLLLRLYDPQSGLISLDGYGIQTISLKTLRDQFGLVRQEPFLFNGTVRENIAYGNLNASLSDIQTAAAAACADSFIQTLPDRYDTRIGERGVKLSVGQKQRIAIARVFLKDPPIIIFDEGTASVDTETEAEIQEGLRNLFAHRTTLIIAHRPSSLRGTDRILVLKDGCIME